MFNSCKDNHFYAFLIKCLNVIINFPKNFLHNTKVKNINILKIWIKKYEFGLKFKKNRFNKLIIDIYQPSENVFTAEDKKTTNQASLNGT